MVLTWFRWRIAIWIVRATRIRDSALCAGSMRCRNAQSMTSSNRSCSSTESGPCVSVTDHPPSVTPPAPWDSAWWRLRAFAARHAYDCPGGDTYYKSGTTAHLTTERYRECCCSSGSGYTSKILADGWRRCCACRRIMRIARSLGTGFLGLRPDAQPHRGQKDSNA
jgi:hypothetical protein